MSVSGISSGWRFRDQLLQLANAEDRHPGVLHEDISFIQPRACRRSALVNGFEEDASLLG